MMNHKRVLARLSAYALAVAILMALGCVPSAQADTIDLNVAFDLGDSKLGAGSPDFPMGWSTPFISIPKVRPVAGDSLRISLSFVDRSTGQPQRLRISELGIGEPAEAILGRADDDQSLNVKAFTFNSFTFHNVMGKILSNPVSVSVITGGSGISASTSPNLTNTSFSFTGITWQIDFSDMTYFSGDGFTLTLFAMGADEIQVIPEPSTWLLVPMAVGLVWLAHKKSKANNEHAFARPREGTERASP